MQLRRSFDKLPKGGLSGKVILAALPGGWGRRVVTEIAVSATTHRQVRSVLQISTLSSLMVSFIHIADKHDEQAILRSGIRADKRQTGVRGVYAAPVVPNFATTHQWARELKRRGIRTLICVQFKISDRDCVLLGKYNGEKLEMTAAEAMGVVLNHTDPMGLEVVIPRKITAREITRTYAAPRTTG